MDQDKLSDADVKILRELGEWAATEAASPRNQEKIAAWYAHDAHEPHRRVMVLAETDGLQDERRAVTAGEMRCTNPWAKTVERRLRQKRFEVEAMRDDHVISRYIEFAPHVCISDFGVPPGRRHEVGGQAYAFHFVPALRDLDDADFAKLKHRTFTWDRPAEEREREQLEHIFRGIMSVRRRHFAWQLGMPLTSTALDLVGLDQFMVLMYDNPEGLHRLMAFLRDDMLSLSRFLEQNGIYDLNNEADYVGSGSMGFTKTLPAPGGNGKVRPRDRWFISESQESVGISPEQYAQFVFPYLRDVAAQFGRVYYGCCEPADPILDSLKTMPHLARVSVSPWANEEKMARFCRESGVAYSRKPTPNIISSERFDEAAQREVMEKTVAVASGCSLEIIQRDVYTTCNQPERFVRWVEMVRDAASRFRR